MIKAAIFDVDGTLLDSMTIWHDVSRLYLARRGIDAPQDLVDRIFTMTLREGCEYIKNLYSISDPVEVLEECIMSEIRDFYYNEVTLKPGARELLTCLHELGIPLAVATAGVRETHEAALSRLGVLDLFSDILVCTELGTSKRVPDIYLRAAESLKAPPCETCVFEDALYAAETAKAAGFHVIGVADGSEAHEREKIISLADAFIYDFYPAYNILKEL